MRSVGAGTTSLDGNVAARRIPGVLEHVELHGEAVWNAGLWVLVVIVLSISQTSAVGERTDGMESSRGVLDHKCDSVGWRIGSVPQLELEGRTESALDGLRRIEPRCPILIWKGWRQTQDVPGEQRVAIECDALWPIGEIRREIRRS